MAVWSHCAQAHAIDETEAGVSRSALVTLTVSSDGGGIAADRAAACPVLVLLSPASCEPPLNLACMCTGSRRVNPPRSVVPRFGPLRADRYHRGRRPMASGRLVAGVTKPVVDVDQPVLLFLARRSRLGFSLPFQYGLDE